ncbi:hypothetical protein ACOME3_000633 [Neoechinorhynchus agilis]
MQENYRCFKYNLTRSKPAYLQGKIQLQIDYIRENKNANELGYKINSAEKSRALGTEFFTGKCRKTCLGDYSRLSKHGKDTLIIGKCLSFDKNECIEFPKRTHIELSCREEDSGSGEAKKG